MPKTGAAKIKRQFYVTKEIAKYIDEYAAKHDLLKGQVIGLAVQHLKKAELEAEMSMSSAA